MPQKLIDVADLNALKALADKMLAQPDYVPPTPIPPTPTGTIYHGVTNHPAPWDMGVLDIFEANAGREVAIVSYFIGWESNTHQPERDRLEAVKARGAVPMITWQWGQIPNLTAILNGNYDQSAHTWAGVLKAYGGPVLLRWGHEMNLPNYAWSVGKNVNTAAQYIAAWKRLRGIFRADGAVNVQWVWCPNVRGGTAQNFVTMFPGATEVEWIGLDGYNWNTPWKTFTQVMQDSYNAIIALTSKPLMIAEYGCVETGGDKGAWLRNALTAEIPALTRIKAAVYFNNQFDGQNWPIESSAAAIASYKAGIASPAYRYAYP